MFYSNYGLSRTISEIRLRFHSKIAKIFPPPLYFAPPMEGVL